jgi:hypothetical protein
VQSVGSGSVWAEEGQGVRAGARIKEIVDFDSEGNN